ncbi:MAG: hypothetical protein H5U11_09225 [Rhizobium sp.]|nr:hypothetical protein [Rhizobium sp.]
MTLLLPVRRHGTFIAKALAEVRGLGPDRIHAAGIALVVSRSLLPFGLPASRQALPGAGWG